MEDGVSGVNRSKNRTSRKDENGGQREPEIYQRKGKGFREKKKAPSFKPKNDRKSGLKTRGWQGTEIKRPWKGV